MIEEPPCKFRIEIRYASRPEVCKEGLVREAVQQYSLDGRTWFDVPDNIPTVDENSVYSDNRVDPLEALELGTTAECEMCGEPFHFVSPTRAKPSCDCELMWL